MPFRRYFPATTRILSFQAHDGMVPPPPPAILMYSVVTHLDILELVRYLGQLVSQPAIQCHQRPGCMCVTGRNADQRGFHPTRSPSTGRFKVPPAVPLLPAVPLCTRVSAGMKPALGRDSSVKLLSLSQVVQRSAQVDHRTDLWSLGASLGQREHLPPSAKIETSRESRCAVNTVQEPSLVLDFRAIRTRDV